MIPGIVAQAMPGTSSGGGVGATELLLGFNGANGTKSFPDEGLRARAVTWLGDVNISTAQSKFGGSSAYFDGSGDGLFINPGPGLIFGSTPFTIEGWFRPSRTGIEALIAQRTGDSVTTKSWSLYKNSSNKAEFQFSIDDTTDYFLNGTSNLTAFTWHHIAVDRDALGVVRLYVNGVMEDSESGITQIREFRKAITIGCDAGGGGNYQGYMDEIRITKGEAKYGSNAGYDVPTGAFARPTRDLTPDPDPYFNNVLLLLGFDGSQDVYEVRDDSNYHRPLLTKDANSTSVPVNASQISTIQPGVFGRQSLVTASTGYNFGDSDDWAFGTDPFTVECWVRYSETLPTSHIVGQRPTFGNNTNSSWEMVIQSTGVLEFQASDGTGNLFISSPPTSSTVGGFRYGWNHLAVTRDGAGAYRLYINGIMMVKDATTTVQNIRNVAVPFTLAAPSTRNDGLFTGNLDEIRITRGTARYTTDTRFDLPEKLFSRNEDGPPSYTVLPTISSPTGFYAVGDLLTLDLGDLNGYEPVIQWRRDSVAIPAANKRMYRLTVEDMDAEIDARVTKWNYSGTTTATAVAVGPIQSAPGYTSGAILTGGDMQSGTDRLIPSGDMQSGTDVLLQRERVS